jgi:hypothetical protein
MRLTIILVLLTCSGSLFLENVHACYQDFLSVQLRSRTIAGTVTLRDKPLEGAVVTLHKFIGAYSIGVQHADPHVLDEAVAGKDGKFTFREVPNGKYVVLFGQPSGASMDVEVIKPKSGENDTIAIEYFADSCVSATVISAEGHRLANRSVPSMFGVNLFAKEESGSSKLPARQTFGSR